jgi:hypothetical protein
MDVTAVSIKQAALQTSLAQTVVKQQAQSEQSLVNIIQQSVSPPTGTRGQNVDISV